MIRLPIFLTLLLTASLLAMSATGQAQDAGSESASPLLESGSGRQQVTGTPPAQDRLQLPASTEVWLVSYGPGNIYWQRFGHNGIWIRDADLGLDHVFNFGFFDFAQENFFLRFLQGKMLYFSAAQPAQQEFAQYINDNRSIRAQRLVISRDQALVLTDYLVREVQPENRDYLYDYYLNNCSTRIRDALDLALEGQIQLYFSPQPAEQNWRDHTRRLTTTDFWLYLGLELVLGAPVDRSISRWDEFFIPSVLADGLQAMSSEVMPGQTAVVGEDIMIYESSLAAPPLSPPSRWWIYLGFSLLILGAAFILQKWLGSLVLVRGWLLTAGITGTAMLFFWFGTDHLVAADNLNLALFNPLWLMVFAGRRWSAVCAWMLIASGAAALVWQLLPPFQYTADVLALFLPLNLAAALSLLRTRS